MINSTLGKVVTAHGAINRIRQRVKGHDALNLFHMKNMLKEKVDFVVEEEAKLIEQYGGIVNDYGMVSFSDKEKKKEYNKDHKELDDMECEIATDPLSMSLEKNPDITLEDIEQLDGFINFK